MRPPKTWAKTLRSTPNTWAKRTNQKAVLKGRRAKLSARDRPQPASRYPFCLPAIGRLGLQLARLQSFLLLQLIDMPVEAVGLEQLLVSTLLGDLPPIQHQDVVRIGNGGQPVGNGQDGEDRKSTRLNSSHVRTSYAVFCLKK